MAIPDYVHPYRMMLACFGHDPRKPLPRLQVLLQLVSSKLELPPTKALQFIAAFRDHIFPVLKAIGASSESFLNIDFTLEHLSAGLRDIGGELGRAATDDPSSVLGNWLESVILVDRKTFDALFAFSLGRLQAATSRPGTRPPALIELDRLCDALIKAAPAAFHAANRAVFEETVRPVTPAARQRFQASLYPLHYLVQSNRHEALDEPEPRAALLDRLRAWEDAAETTIYAVVRFIWLMSTYQPHDELIPVPPSLDRKAILHAAIEWCEINSIPFPFRPDLYDIREALARKCFECSDSAVRFTDEAGRTLATLTMDEATAVIERDVLFATNFSAALPFTGFRYANLLGRFDDAWSTARARIPGLELMTVDMDSIRPDLRRNKKWPYFTPRYFGERRVGGASLWARRTANVVASAPRTKLDGPDRLALELLLHSLFSDPERLSMFLTYQPDGARLVNSLPPPTVSMQTWTHAAVRELLADGRLNAQFFADLAADRPFRKPEIDEMRRRVLE